MSETTKKPTTRRALMGNAGSAALAGLAAVLITAPDGQAVEVLPPTPGGDALLLALCGRFLELQGGIDASYAREREQHDALKKQGALYKQLNALEMEGEAKRKPLEDEQWD